MFAQKSNEDDMDVAPIINSKFQETAFQKAFNAYAEDIGNTSYDASVQHNGEKYLVGIKTFGISSGDQKVAQFKAKHDEWARIIDELKTNATGIDDELLKDKLNIAKITFTSGANAASQEYSVKTGKDRCPLCGIALDDSGVCQKCGYTQWSM